MCEWIAWQQPLADVTLFEQGVVGVNLISPLFAQSDVEHLQLSYELLVLSEKERELLMLERECHIGTDDVGADIIGVILGHKSGRNVDADNLRG